MAQYCAIVGLAYQQARQEDRWAIWGNAADLFKKAREARPKDAVISRGLHSVPVRLGPG